MSKIKSVFDRAEPITASGARSPSGGKGDNKPNLHECFPFLSNLVESKSDLMHRFLSYRCLQADTKALGFRIANFEIFDIIYSLWKNILPNISKLYQRKKIWLNYFLNITTGELYKKSPSFSCTTSTIKRTLIMYNLQHHFIQCI